jgi:hypothetical protein
MLNTKNETILPPCFSKSARSIKYNKCKRYSSWIDNPRKINLVIASILKGRGKDAQGS